MGEAFHWDFNIYRYLVKTIPPQYLYLLINTKTPGESNEAIIERGEGRGWGEGGS